MQKLVFKRPEITMKFTELKPFIESVVRSYQIGFNVLLDFLINNLNKILTEVADGEVLVINMYDNLSYFTVRDDQVDKVSNLICNAQFILVDKNTEIYCTKFYNRYIKK